MTQIISSSGHDDIVHDAVLDYYGRRLATASSDKTLKIFDIDSSTSPPTHRLTANLTGHEAAVWCAAWSHPKFGVILASSSYDGRILIWKEVGGQGGQAGSWQKVHEVSVHSASVNIVAWSPSEVGCHLAAASSDGEVSVTTFENNAFSSIKFPAHGLGVNSVSWAPALLPGQLTSAQTGKQPEPQRRFVTGGSDNLVKLWTFNGTAGSFDNTATLAGHSDWVRDVAWSPTPLSKQYIASASQDHTVKVWTLPAGKDINDASAWQCETLDFEVVVWRVSWSMAGNVLAVSGGDNRVSLWKEKLKGGWELVKTLEE
ncbi:putative nuclear pore complex subunit [Teratosphaeria nubilosa]|uniref:Protein transport protein SEC13 n=1 Tax=Teratosphaeria nubilosa TaxID=161662 RepID=A0A6G1LFY5_9PEZI|nr:putative nuclear pore complex subunit [Teratosphaeria nubilosa]